MNILPPSLSPSFACPSLSFSFRPQYRLNIFSGNLPWSLRSEVAALTMIPCRNPVAFVKYIFAYSYVYFLSLFLSFTSFLSFFFLPFLPHVEVPWPGIESAPQQQPWPLQWQRQILTHCTIRELPYMYFLPKTEVCFVFFTSLSPGTRLLQINVLHFANHRWCHSINIMSMVDPHSPETCRIQPAPVLL